MDCLPMLFAAQCCVEGKKAQKNSASALPITAATSTAKTSVNQQASISIKEVIPSRTSKPMPLKKSYQLTICYESSVRACGFQNMTQFPLGQTTGIEEM